MAFAVHVLYQGVRGALFPPLVLPPPPVPLAGGWPTIKHQEGCRTLCDLITKAWHPLLGLNVGD